ncbi:Mitochondrial matrix cochaperone [Entophlyctis sp. JEL0112]|nr:Mitochondrial matrix cochaperone [Entophlyctis sp. JEL0112]
MSLLLRSLLSAPRLQSSASEQQPQQPQDADAKIAAIVAEKDKQIADLQDMYRRSLADMENMRQRTKREVENASTFAITKFAKDLLDTADVLEIALKSVPESERAAEQPAANNKTLRDFYAGVSMTHDNLIKSFKRFGVEPFADDAMTTFDHNLHQAVFQAPIPGKESGSICEVIKKGYMIHGRVLRSAQVGVVQ